MTGRTMLTRIATAALALAILAAPALFQTAAAQSANTPAIALACASCHGPNGAGVGSIPAIARQDRAAFLQSWAAFRANERPATIMNRIARGYTDAEVAALADYFANLR
jgi:sulfide dehydrogenase cytochrome subunit